MNDKEIANKIELISDNRLKSEIIDIKSKLSKKQLIELLELVELQNIVNKLSKEDKYKFDHYDNVYKRYKYLSTIKSKYQIDRSEREGREERQERQEPIQLSLDKIVYYYLDNIENKELEVRFKSSNITKIIYDNVIKRLMYEGFYTCNKRGEYLLRINVEDNSRISSLRTEIRGIKNLDIYCSMNDISKIYNGVSYIYKKGVVTENGQYIMPVIFPEFGFKVSLQIEEPPYSNLLEKTKNTWMHTKKSYKYMNRVEFKHPDYPLKVHLSIAQYSKQNSYTVNESGVFSSDPVYEIEIELDNN